MTRYAVIVIDMLNDFVRGKLKCERAERIIPNIKRLIDEARRRNLPIIYTKDSHIKNVDKELELWGEHALKGTNGSEIIDELKPTDKDYVIEKRRYSAFFQTDLDLLLRELNVDTLILTGISTDVCVKHTAADAFFRGYKIVVVEDCVEAFTEEGHKSALEYMKRIYGAKIVKLSELLKEL